MKQVFWLFTLTFMLLISGPAMSQHKSLLWQISGKGLPAPSYLYGTVHAICADDFEMKQKVLDAFDKSGKLVLEVNLSDPAEMQTAQRLMTSDKKLSSSLTPDEQHILDSSLKKYLNVSLDKVDNLVPLALESMMAMSIIKCADRKMYEMEFIQLASKSKKPIGNLETMADQFAYSEKAFTAKDVVKHIQLMPENAKLFSQMINYYKQQDLDGLMSIASDKRFMTAEAQHWLLDVRNKAWAAKMPAMMKDETVFFAVGAIHLTGNNGVIELLKKEGYTLTPVLD